MIFFRRIFSTQLVCVCFHFIILILTVSFSFLPLNLLMLSFDTNRLYISFISTFCERNIQRICNDDRLRCFGSIVLVRVYLTHIICVTQNHCCDRKYCVTNFHHQIRFAKLTCVCVCVFCAAIVVSFADNIKLSSYSMSST